jgi:hypothetical protein
MVPMTVSMQYFALCVSGRGLSLHLRVVAMRTLAMGKGKVAKGKVAKFANNDMYVKGNVHNMKTKAMHATAHAMNNVKRTVGTLVPNGEEEEPVIFEAEAGEEPKDVVKEEEDTPCAKAYYHFNRKLATAPKAVQEEEGPKTKALPHRSGKQGKLQHMAVAFAKSGWNRALCKSIDELDMHRPQQRKWPRHTPGRSW